jgi:putative transcriptional regulator
MSKRNRKQARRVRELRRRLGLTQYQLADLLGCHQPTISHWESGHTRPGGFALRLLDQLEERAAQEQENP